MKDDRCVTGQSREAEDVSSGPCTEPSAGIADLMWIERRADGGIEGRPMQHHRSSPPPARLLVR